MNAGSVRLFSLVLRLSLPFMLAAPAACTADTSTQTAASKAASQTAPDASKPALEEEPYPIHFDSTTMTIKGKVFTVEVAATQAQEMRGLMYRNSMPEDHGMIFFLGEEQKISFWMHNTRIPLDIIFLDKDGKVLDIFNRKPLDDAGTGPDSPALSVIELNGGMANKLGLKKGDTVEVPKIPAP